MQTTKKWKQSQQVGTELGQAQLKLGLDFCRTPVLGLGLWVDFTYALDNNYDNNNDNNDNNNDNNKCPHLNFLEMNSTRW